MAKNWTAAEATDIIVNGEDISAVKDITRRFPLFVYYVLRNPIVIISSLEKATARTLNKRLEEYTGIICDEEDDGVKVVVSHEKVSAVLESHKNSGKKEEKVLEEVKEEKVKVKVKVKEKEDEKVEVKKEKVEKLTKKDMDFDIEHLLE